MDALHFEFSKVFDMLSHSNLVCKLECYNLDRWTTRWKKLVGWFSLMVNGLYYTYLEASNKWSTAEVCHWAYPVH